MKQLKQKGIFSILIMILVLGSIAGYMTPAYGNGFQFIEDVYAEESVSDAPTRGQISVNKFVQSETNYLGGVALDASGKVWTWGYNAYGMLGTGDTVGSYAGGMKRLSYFVKNKINVVQVIGGYHTTLALDDKGVVYAWGNGLEGQMGNGAGKINNNSPQIVTSLNGIKIKKIRIGDESASAVYALSEDGDMYAWGYASGYRINGYEGYVKEAKLINDFKQFDIKDFDLGDQHGVLLTEEGDVYTWGYNDFGQLGYGNTTLSNAPQKVDFGSKKIEYISATSDTTMAVTEDGEAYQWGRIYKASSSAGSETYNSPGGPIEYKTSGALKSITSPELVTFDLNSTRDASGEALYKDAPKAKSVAAGKYVNYLIDTHGRVWYWGYNYAYGFATDGPLFVAGDGGKHGQYLTDANLLKTMGDGDTEEYTYESAAKGPVFSSAPASSIGDLYLSYSKYGQWTGIYDGLHPTIYDKKYCKVKEGPIKDSHQDDYLIDKDGRVIIYVIKSEGGTSRSGNFYVAEEGYSGDWCVNMGTSTALPAGVTTETSVPVVKDEERGWIGASVDVDNFDYTGHQYNPLPYMSSISTYQSSVLMLDNSGNLYKQSLDGSGSIAWGWDYSEYEKGTAGNNASMGLYNFYNYELTYMRGAPSATYIDIEISKPKTKIYKEEGSTKSDTVTVSAIVPNSSDSAEPDSGISSELTGLRYVFIPYDKTDANMNIENFTKEQFEEAYANSAYTDKGSLLDSGKEYKEGEYEFSIDVTDNGKIWVMAEDQANTDSELYKAIYTADNFYTPTKLEHRGVGEPGDVEIYEATEDNVSKINKEVHNYKDEASEYGLPLDINGNLIEDPYFGYDEVNLKSYDFLSDDKSFFWQFKMPQDSEINYTLNDVKYINYKDGELIPYVHDFYYEQNENEVTKAAGDADGNGKAEPGEMVTYTITLKNNSETKAVNIPVKDDLKNVLPYIVNPGTNGTVDTVTVDNDGDKSFATIDDLINGITISAIEAGKTVTITFDVKIDPDIDTSKVTVITNIAVVAGGEIEEKIPTGELPEKNAAGEKIVKDDNGDGFASPGEKLTYTINFKNTGNTTSDAIYIKDSLDKLMDYIDAPENEKLTIDVDGSKTEKAVKDLMDGLTLDALSVDQQISLEFNVKVKSDIDLTKVSSLANIAVIQDEEFSAEIPTEIEKKDVEKKEEPGDDSKKNDNDDKKQDDTTSDKAIKKNNPAPKSKAAENTKNAAGTKTQSPKTGDDLRTPFLVGIILSALLLTGVIMFRRKTTLK